MSLDDAGGSCRIRARTGRYPLLYTNDVTATHIAEQRDRYWLLSRLPLWYARYKPEIAEHFRKGTDYALWQFSRRPTATAAPALPRAWHAQRHRRQRRADERRVARRLPFEISWTPVEMIASAAADLRLAALPARSSCNSRR